MKVRAYYPQGEMWEAFEAETMALVKQQIEADLADPDGFSYAMLDDNDNQTGPSVKYSELEG